jgi:hypothetical protein
VCSTFSEHIMRRRLVLLLAVVSGQLGAQLPSVEWERPIIAPSSPSATQPYTEPYLAVNPADPRHLVAVAVRPNPAAESSMNGCAALVSRDGGAKWSETVVGDTHCVDPWVAFASSRVVLFSTMGGMGQLNVLRSEDGGDSWATDPQLSFGTGHDHPVLAPVSTGGAYVVSSRTVRESGMPRFWPYVTFIDSSARTRTEPVILRPSNLTGNTLKSAVLSDGTLFALFIDYRGMSGMGEPTAPPLDRRRVWAYRSTDGGRTFSAPLFVTEQCGRERGFAELVSGPPSGSFKDNLFLACFRQDRNALIVVRSADRGEHWTETVAVEAATPTSLARTASIAVGPEGVIGVTWYDRRDDPSGECQYLYFAASKDGGASFTAPVRVSTARSCPGAAGNRNGWAAGRWAGGGDYSGLVALPGGRFVAVWTDSRSGVYQPYAAQIQAAP